MNRDGWKSTRPGTEGKGKEGRWGRSILACHAVQGSCGKVLGEPSSQIWPSEECVSALGFRSPGHGLEAACGKYDLPERSEVSLGGLGSMMLLVVEDLRDTSGLNFIPGRMGSHRRF